MAQLADQSELGPNQEGLFRIVYQMQSQMSAFAPGRIGAKPDPLRLRPQQMRVPAFGGPATESILFWSRFFQCQLDPATPLLLFLPIEEGWLDVTLGEPTSLYRGLHAAADAAFDAIAAVLSDGALLAQVIEAARVIEDAGFTTIDDLLHGYGGGYLPPILGSATRPAGPVPDEPFRAGMTVVIQPNVVTRDGMAGVQTGEMVLITESGIERMHAMPRGFLQIEPSP